ncbi:ATP-dependent sacrificial sulfur transferase LarE [Tepidibacillus sp. LV47]|uniref:ATP-dependent sacrificial sulfur transferase LarE n=1 Tax=Tepidibacillus sp. LV47 TaxID=3398228 RepID=UPI003AAE3BC0
MNLIEKEQQLIHQLKQMKRVLIALSGGVDSTYLAKMAYIALGENAIAVTIENEFIPKREVEEAYVLAKKIGIPHKQVYLDALSNENISANPADRCFFCKTHLFTHLMQIAKNLNIETIIDGSNLDDMQDYRPGLKALYTLGIRSPLKEIGFSKKEIRERSKAHDLPTWDKPSFSCLASRIPYNERITREKLQQIDHAEQFLFELGLKQFRVRHHGVVARIEVLPEDFPRILANYQTIVEKLKALGFQYVTLDLEGYRTGSLNRQLIGIKE